MFLLRKSKFKKICQVTFAEVPIVKFPRYIRFDALV